MIYLGLISLTAISCWFFPLFHIRPIRAVTDASQPKDQSPKSSGPGQLEAYTAGATNVVTLWNAFEADAAEAKKKFGKQAGLGGAFYFCISGTGTVAAATKDRIELTVEGSSKRVCLELSVVMGNIVRDAIGIKASQFANSQEFNAVSSDLNRQIEETVIAPNRERLTLGAQCDFVGCAKIGGTSDLDPLCLIPIQLKYHP